MLRCAISAVALLLAVLSTAESRQRPGTFRLVDDATHDSWVSLIPETDDEHVRRLKADPRLIVFTEAVLPPVFQAADNGTLGVFRVGTSFNVLGANIGHGSNQYPWRTPAGFGASKGFNSFRFLWLPPGEPIEIVRRRQPDDVQAAVSIGWRFPVGTIAGECFQVLGVATPDQYEPTFELRVRRKLGDGTWHPDVFRPFATREELDWAVAMSGDRGASRFVGSRDVEPITYAVNPFTSVTSASLVVRTTGAELLRKSTAKDMLPPLERDTVLALLSRPFVSIRGAEWSEHAAAPDAKVQGHIVPAGYNGAMLTVSQAACASCHSTAGRNVREFNLTSPQGWDEWVRGNPGDASFTWHPFDVSSISTGRAFRPVSFNQALINAGLLVEKR